MFCQDNILGKILNFLTEAGFDGMGEAFRVLLNEAMNPERQKYLGAGPYERSDGRKDYANGYKPKTIKTRVGELELAVPQVRGGGFYPSSIEKGQRSERALKLSLAEMYLQGVSTRKVATITEGLCGFDVSSSQVSRATKELDGIIEEWRNRRLGPYPYVYLDAEYQKIRQGGCVIDAAVLIAIGIDETGKREVLGTFIGLSEAEVHWRQFLKGLQDRGLHGVRLLISDDHSGLKAARMGVFPGIPWQRCRFHLQQNAQHYVPRQHMQKEVGDDIRNIFNAPSEAEARRLLGIFMGKYKTSAPKLVEWAEENLIEGMTVFQFPQKHWQRIRTANMVERLHREIRRRTRAVSIFPNEKSCLRLISAVLMETSEDWLSGRVYLKMS
jgi:putative transposase